MYAWTVGLRSTTFDYGHRRLLSTLAKSKRVVAMAKADLVVSARWIATVEKDDHERVLENSSVVVNDGKIVDILGTSEVKEKYEHVKDWRTFDDHILLPGLVNAHTHASMTLMRGKADDEPLNQWLQDTVWPIEMALAKEEFCYDGTLLSAVEMLKSGTTTFNDMYWFPMSAAEAVVETGIRASLGMIMIGFPSAYAGDTDEYIRRGNEAREKYGKEDNIHFTYAPHAPYTVNDDILIRLGKLCEEEDVQMHIHMHETEQECRHSEALDRSAGMGHLSDFAGTPVANFERHELLSKRIVAAHMNHVTDEEIKLLAERQVNVVHCPSSNLKLASGFCPVGKMVDAGVNVAIGTDGSASNNALDMIAEMKLVAILAKAVKKDPTCVPASMALKMATLNGAKALGLEDKIGSLEVGKCADMITVELGGRAATSPVFNPISTLVYSAHGADVTDAWVNGKLVMKDRRVVLVDEQSVLARSHKWVDRINDLPLKKKSTNSG